jgi:hypothetical protein
VMRNVAAVPGGRGGVSCRGCEPVSAGVSAPRRGASGARVRRLGRRASEAAARVPRRLPRRASEGCRAGAGAAAATGVRRPRPGARDPGRSGSRDARDAGTPRARAAAVPRPAGPARAAPVRGRRARSRSWEPGRRRPRTRCGALELPGAEIRPPRASRIEVLSGSSPAALESGTVA